MTLTDLTPLLPTDEELAARRDAFVTELAAHGHRGPAAAAPARTRRRVARRIALPLAAAAGVALAVVAIPKTGAPDVVAEARAATAPGDFIVHVVTELQDPGGASGTARWGARFETWTTADPYRRRTLTPARHDGRPATVESVGDDASYRIRRSWDEHDIVRRLSPEDQEVQRRVHEAQQKDPYLPATAFVGEDPLRAIRVLLRQGRLHPQGRTTLDGREVVRLTAKTPRKVTPLRSGDFVDPAVSFEYLVDATTYAPVQMTAVTHLDGGRQDRSVVRFVTYERLPDTPENRKLLELQPAAR